MPCPGALQLSLSILMKNKEENILRTFYPGIYDFILVELGLGPLHPSTEGAAILNPQGAEVVMTEDCSVGLGAIRKSWC